MSVKLIAQFDGGSRGNPGPAGYGAVVATEDGTVVMARGGFVGTATNNVAEYRGLIAALAMASELNATSVDVRGDSQLVIMQMLGKYKVKNPGLKPLHDQAKKLAQQFSKVQYGHTYREFNALADSLANKAMDLRKDVTDNDL